MNCATCKVHKISPRLSPFGGYLCTNEHFQCNQCNQRYNGQCGICQSATSFVPINGHGKSSNAERVTCKNQSVTIKTEKFGHTSWHFPASEVTNFYFTKEIIADIDTQSSISQEKLSLPASKLSVSKEVSNSDTFILSEKSPMVNCSFTDLEGVTTPTKQMETLFMGSKQSRHAAVNRYSNEYGNEGGKTSNQAPNKIPDPNKDYDNGSINTSDIRFMESFDSLANYYPANSSRRNSYEADTDTPRIVSQQQPLTERMVHDLECHNSTNRIDHVETYLTRYGPHFICHFPDNPCSMHNCCHPVPYEVWPHRQQNAMMRSVSVSTESEPSLQCSKEVTDRALERRANSPSKYPQPEYFVMQATVAAKAPTGDVPLTDNLGKKINSSLDQRMQKVLGTFHEDPSALQSKISEQGAEHSKKLPRIASLEESFLRETTSSPPTIVDVENSNDFCLSTESSSLDITHPEWNAHRALHNPCKNKGEAECTSDDYNIEPPPQFQLIVSPSVSGNILMEDNPMEEQELKPLRASQLSIARLPFCCPVTSCRRIIFVSDFIKHMMVDHTKLPMERITSGQCKNFFLDPRVSCVGTIKCHILYLIRNKLTDLGSSKYKDLLPMLVMSTRVPLSDIVENSEPKNATDKTTNFLMIWLAGIVPEKMPLRVSLIVWPHYGTLPNCHKVYSDELFPIRDSLSTKDVFKRGQRFLLSNREVEFLTEKGKKMLELQVIVH